MTKTQALEDLFLAIRRYLINEGRTPEVAKVVATNAVNKAIELNVTIKDIKKMRDVFIG